ncbi:uncharacterized protein LOC121379797 [Gigantopelta aegis]|uniref:uncharacterized protein LOC121379797 n=1 Tax=Gigantopelta aegis TaxID=1735272 RepID=UPI001B88C8B4|nr:uncharacterized protein LOC121379797 [Gigantopelta aegis]
MGLLGQLGLLFKKNFILRKRHPGVIVLEVLWPVLVVALIAIVRLGILPSLYTTCHYQARAMPSAGITPFLQTFVCNMDNECHDEESLKLAQETTYSVSALVQDLSPHLGAPATVEALKVMSTGVKIMDKLKEIADDEELVTGLGDALKVRTFFHDPKFVKKVLTEEFKLMTSEQADAFLDATFNITYVFDLMKYPNFKEVVCDPQKLGSFLLFPENVNITAISENLCNIHPDTIPPLTTFLQKQIDIAEIIRIIGTFEKLKSRGKDYSLSRGLMDTADMLDLIFKQPSILEAINGFSEIKTLPDFIRRIPEMIKTFNSSSFDVGSIIELMNFLDPIIEQAKPNDTLWSSIKLGITITGDLSDMLSGKWNGSLSEMLDKVQDFLFNVDQSLGSVTGDMKLIIEALTNLDWTSLFGQAVNKTINEEVTLSSLNSLQVTLEKLSFWNMTASVTSVINKFLQIGIIMLEETEDLERGLTVLVGDRDELRKSLTKLFERGPDITLAVLREFTDPQTISKLFQSSFTFQTFCFDVLDKLNATISQTELTNLKKNLCHGNVSTIMHNFLQGLRVENVTTLMNETVQHIHELLTGNFQSSEANITLLYMRSTEFQNKLKSFMNITGATWKNLFTNLNLKNIDLHERQWEPVLKMLDQNYVAAGFLGIMRGWGYAMQSSSLPYPIPMYVHVAKTAIKFSYEYLKVLTDVYSPSSVLGQLLHYWSTYAPQLVEGSIRILTNHTDMLKAVIFSKDPLQQICQDRWFDLMQLPAYVPANKLESLLCDTNWTAVIADVISTQTGFTTLVEDIQTAMNENSTYDTELDWADILDYTERLVDMAKQPGQAESLFVGPWNLFSQVNFTQITRAVEKATSSLSNWALKDFTKMSEVSIQVLDGLDTHLINVTSWRALKHSFKAFSAYMRFMNSYYRVMLANSSSMMDLIDMYPSDFKDYVIKMAKVTPDLIEALKNTIINPDKLLEKLFTNGFKVAPDCSTTWLTDFLVVSTPNLKEFENLTCSLNWTKFGLEMSKFNPDLAEYNDEIALLIGNMKNLPDVKLNWTRVFESIEEYNKIMSRLFYPRSFDLSPFNVTAIDMKWTDFVAGMKSLEKMGTDKLLSLMDSIQKNMDKLDWGAMFGTNTSSDLIIKSAYAGLYIQHKFYKFLITVLEDFNSTTEVNMLDYLGSDELRRVVRAIELIPEVNTMGLDTVIQFIMDPNKAAVLLNSSQLCGDLSVFRDVFDLELLTTSGNNVSAKDLQTAVCGLNINVTVLLQELKDHWNGFEEFFIAKAAVCGLNINVTVLLQELKDHWNGFEEFFIAMENLSTDKLTADEVKVNISTMVDDNSRYQALLQSIIQHPPTVVIFADMSWMNQTVYEKEWQRFVDKMNTTLMKFEEPSFMRKWQMAMIDTMLASFEKIPNFDMILQYLDAILDLVEQRLKQSLVSLPEAFKDYPNLSNLLYLVDQFPDVFEVYIYTSLKTPEKAKSWPTTMATWDQFCATDSDVLFTVPPSSSFNMSSFLHRMCQLNFTKLANELNNYQGTERLKELITNGTTAYSVNVSTIATKLSSLVESLTNTTSSSKKTGFELQLFNSTIWKDVMERIGNYYNTYSFNSLTSSYIFSYYESILKNVPALKDQMGWVSTIAVVAESLFDRLLIVENATSFSLSTFFEGAPEMQKLVELVQEPGLVEVLLESINSRKFLPLFESKNATATLIKFCDPAENISQYFTIPEGLSVNLTEWRIKFCRVNISIMVDEEANTIFNLDKISSVANGSSDIDWMTLGDKYKRVVDLINRWAENPPMLNTTENWQNGSFWLNMLQQYGKARQNPEELNQQIENMFLKLGPLLEQESFRQFGLVMETVLKLLNKNLVAMENTTMTVSSLFDKVPILKDVITAIGLSPSILDTLLKAPVKDIELFMKAMTSATTSICTKDDSVWRDMLQLPDTFNMSALHRAICNQNITELEENLLKNLDLKDLLSSLSNTSAKPDWLMIFNLSQQFSQNIKLFVDNLPKFDVNGSREMFQNAYNVTKLLSQMSSRMTFQLYGSMLESIPGLQKEMGWFVTMIKIQNFIFDRLLVLENATSFQLQDLFPDSPEIEKLIEFIQKPGVIEVLLISVNTPKFLPLLSSSNATATLMMICNSSTDMSQYLTVPDNLKSTVNPNTLRDLFCEVNFTTLMEEATSLFNITFNTDYYNSSMDWAAVGDKYDRVMTMITEWARNPPQIIIPSRWENGSFWLDLLQTYTDSRNKPEAIVQELESFLAKLSPLLDQEQFRQVGLVLQTVLQLFNENVISMNNGSYTLNSMFLKIPVLHDIVSALNLSPDVLDALLKSPVNNPHRLAETLTVASTKDAVCANSEMWRDILSLPDSFNTSALNEAFCNQNISNIVENLVKNLDLENLIDFLGNSSAEPDWTTIFTQIQELVKNLNSLITNPPSFNFSESMAAMESAYNTSELWNFISIYSTLSKIFGNSSEFDAVEGYLKGATVVFDFLNDILDKAKVTGVTLDLASLFKDSPTFIKLFNVFLNLNPDPLTGLLSIQLKTSQTQAFASVAADEVQLKEVFCNKNRFLEYFDVIGSLNVTAMLDVMCTLNFTAMVSELETNFMVDALNQKLKELDGSKFDLIAYIETYKNLTNKLTELAGIRNVTFGRYNLQDLTEFNTTVLLDRLTKQMDNVKKGYEGYSLKSLDKMFAQFSNDSSWQSVLIAFKTFDLFLKHFNQYLTDIKDKPLSLELLLKETELGKVLIPLLKDPAWLDQLLQTSVKPDKLTEFVQSENATDILCSSELWDAFVLPANGSAALKHLQEQACSINSTLLMWQSFVVQMKGYTLKQQSEFLQREADAGRLTLNSTEMSLDMRTTVDLLTTLISNMKNSTASQFLNVEGFKAVLDKFKESLIQKLLDLSAQWSTAAANIVWPSLQNSVAATQMTKVINTANIFLESVNDKLSSMLNDNVTLSSLLGHTDALVKLMETYINVSKHGLDSWIQGNFNIEKLIELLKDKSLLNTKCRDNSVASFISDSASPSMVVKDLEIIVCTYSSKLPDAFNSYTDIEQIKNKIVQIWISTTPGAPDFSGYIANVKRFSNLMTRLATSKLAVSNKLKKTLNFSTLLTSLQSLGDHPTLIIQLLKPLGLLLSGPLSNMNVKYAMSMADRFWILPIVRALEAFHEKGFSLSSVLKDPSKLAQMVEYFTNYNNQLSISLPTMVQPIFSSISREPSFKSDYICNKTVILPKLSPIKLEYVADVLCNTSALKWLETLQQLGLGNAEIYGLSVQLSSALWSYKDDTKCVTMCDNVTHICSYTCSSSVRNPILSSDVSWFQLMTDIEKLVNFFQQDSTMMVTQSPVKGTKGTWNTIKKILLNDTLNNILGVLKMMDYSAMPLNSNMMDSFKKYVRFITSINSFLSDFLHNFSGQTSPIYLQDILPNSHIVADVLNEIFGPNFAAQFLTASVNPTKFYSLAFTEKWKDLACNPVEFNNTFTFEAGTDVTRLQTDLCTAATTQTSAVKRLVDLFDAGAILRQLENLMSGSTNTTRDVSVWDSVYNVTRQLLTNLEKLGKVNVNQTSVSTWFKPILSTLQALGNPSISSLNQACDSYLSYINGTETYRQLTPMMSTFSKLIKLFTANLAISTSIDEITCDLLSNWNLTAVTTRLKKDGFWDIFKIMNSFATDDSSSIRCSAVTNSAYNLFETLNATMATGGNVVTNWDKCFEKSKFDNVLDSIAQVIQISSDVVRLLQDSSLRQLLNKQKNLVPILEFIFNVISQQNTVFFRVSDILKSINGTDPKDYLIETLKLSPDIANSFLKSALDLNLTAFASKPLEEIERILCNESLLTDFMTMPDFSPVNMSSLVSLVCTDQIKETSVAIKATVDTMSVLQQLAKLTNSDVDQLWFRNFTTHVVDLIKNFQSIGDLASLFSNGFNLDSLEKNLPIIDRFLLSSGPDRLVQSLQVILEDIKLLMKDNTTNYVLDEMKVFIRGFMGLDLIQSYLIKAIRVGDFVENPIEVQKYLVQVLGIDPSLAKAILEGKYSIRIFLNASRLLETGLTCNELFGHLIYPNTSTVQTSDLTNIFCSLNQSTAVKLAKRLIPNLDIGDLLKKYISLDAGSLFKDSGVTKEDLKDFTDKLFRAQDNLLKATDFMKSANNKTSKKLREIMDEIFNLPQAQTGAQSLPAIEPLLCGVKKKSLAKDEFNVKPFISDSKSDAQKEKDEKTSLKKVDEQINSTQADFCEKMYTQIKNDTYGSIIWAYLKPIIRGKILFTPNTELTRRIMKKANGVFEIIEEVKNVADAWAEGGPSLATMMDQGKELKSLKNLLNNNFVKSLLKSSAGLDSEKLLDGLDALESDNVNKTSLDGLTKVAELVSNYISCMELKRFTPVESEQDLLAQAFNLSKTNDFLAGVVFNLPRKNRRKRGISDTDIPKHISYKIRMDTDNVRITNRLKARFWYPNPESNFGEYMRYLRGFVQLQDMVDQAIISLQTGENDTLPAVYLKQFPFPCHNQDSFIFILGSYLVPVLMTFAWLATLGITTRNLVWDRENGQEVIFSIMGMKSSLNWFAWFISSMLLMLFVCFILTLLLVFSVKENGEIYRYSNGVLIFVFLVCFCFSSTMMCYMVSSFFTRTTLAVLTVLIVYFFSYLPYVILFSLEVGMQFWQKILACLSSTTAFGFGAMYIARLELTTDGLQWSNVDKSPILGDPMTFQWACIMMLIDSFIYLVIGWYIRNVKPGKYGISKPWYFPVTATYWCLRKHRSRSTQYGIDGPAAQPGKESMFEPAPVGLDVGMSVYHLTKKFGKSLVVNDLTAEFYEGQVTALLGHNGAAKTTTLNLLLGLLEPTSGDVRIYNKHSVDGDSMIGVCPQHNALLQYMTIEEHMYLYAGIKCSWSSKKKKLEIHSLLEDVDLWHVRHVMVSELSGGMQRRLCVALAFVGGSRAIVLDEPTSGVDPSARKCIWNLILKNKPGRTILLSTHHLDEADMIGDRIAIMHMGQLLCSGTPMFLKEKIGGGYHLTIERASYYDTSPEPKSNIKSHCSSQAVLNFIQHYLPSAQLVEEVGSEIIFQLPVRDRSVTPFHRFFQELDLNQDGLCISSYGVSDTTLEDVFLKVTSLADDGVVLTDKVLESEEMKMRRSRAESEAAASEAASDTSQETTVTMISSSRARKASGCGLKMQQFGALFLKRFHHYRRDWRSLVSILLLPFLLFLAAMGFALIRPSDSNMPNLIMTPALYGPDKYMFFKDGYEGSNPISNKLVKAFTSAPGIGTTCMDGFNSGPEFQCTSQGSNFTQQSYTMNPEAKCVCWNWEQQCDPGADFPPPPELQVMSGNNLQNLDRRDIPEYLLKSFSKFIELRYGGWAMEQPEEASTNATAVQVWFNNKGYHSLPSFFNGYSNALLRAKVDPASNPAEYGITTYNHPITLHGLQLSFENLGQQAADAGIAMVILLAYSFIPAALMIYLINERINKEKQMQFISGVRPAMYWTASFLWDLILYACTVVLMIVAIAIFRNGAYWEFQNLPATICLILLFGWAVIPMMYCMLRLFSSASSAYMVLFCGNMFFGLVTVILIVVLSLFKDESFGDLTAELRVLRYVFLIFPQYCLGQGLIDLNTNYFTYKLFIRFGENVYKDPFTFDLIGWKLVAMAIQGVVFFILNLIIENKRKSLIRVPHHLLEDMKEEEDVARERTRIQQGHTKEDILVVNDLSKVFKRGSNTFLAVDRLSFGVNKGECFGLLGVNGAGKTTTFQMMTGDTRQSAGSTLLNGKKISYGDSSLIQSVGYCPQDGGLDNFLTGAELLHFHSRLKGLSAEQRDSSVTELISRLHLTQYANKPISTYSGGTKRKLSLAIAMLGEPPVLFLDEPTTGMDPGTRRLAWKCITHTVRAGQSVVLTSHSMNECDALCSRLAIMVNGRLMCIGSGQHLKNKFGDGYTVIMHLQGLSSTQFSIEHLFLSRFAGAAVKVSSDVKMETEHQKVLEVNIPRGVTCVAELFGILEQAQEEGHISYYSLSQTTLDTVFINFARLQTDADDEEDDEASSNSQSQNLHAGAFSNQSYAYMNPQFSADPNDINIEQMKFANSDTDTRDFNASHDGYYDARGRFSVKM